jgi:hypothetical protein
MKDRKSLDNEEKTGSMDTPPATRRGKGHAGLTRDIQAKIGQQLRAYYDGLLEPTPDRFAELLRELDKSGGRETSE